MLMPKSRLTYLGTCLATFVAFASGCAAPGTDNPQGAGGSSSGGSSGTAGTTGTGGTGTGGTTGVGGSSGGSSSTAGSSGGSTSPGAGGNSVAGSSGGSSSTAGSSGGSSTARGGSGGSTAGSSGGSSSTAGSGGGGGSTARGGSGGTAGSGTAGAAGGSTGAGGTGVRMDQAGIPLARPGDSTNMSRKYLNLGDMRLINNRWGSDERNCSGTQQRVYVNTDRSIGWEFNRPACGGDKAKPDYPEVEFGVAPFGANSSLLTTPSFSSTTLLPIQLTSLTSASVNVDTMFISLQRATTWNINVELWLSQRNPVTDPNPGVHSEIIAFWGWEANRQSSSGGWPCGTNELSKGTMTSGPNTYDLCHQSDNWSSGWRFYNFIVKNGPLTAYSGKVDVKAMIDWVISKYAIPNNLWLTRIEVGSEIDDNTQGTVRIKNLTFEINNQSRSIELQP
jgi:hypothetical protein